MYGEIVLTTYLICVIILHYKLLNKKKEQIIKQEKYNKNSQPSQPSQSNKNSQNSQISQTSQPYIKYTVYDWV